MKILRRVITIFIVFLLSLFYINIVNATNAAKVTADTVRIREKANTDSSILELISLNEEVEIIEKEDDWYKIKYKDITGYVKANLLSLNETEEKTPEETQNPQTEEQNVEEDKENEEKSAELKVNQEITTKSDIKLKILPLINSSDILTINTSTNIKITEIINDWSYVQNDSVSGWVRNSVLISMLDLEKDSKVEDKKEDKTDTEKTEKKNETTITIKKGYVNVDTVNLRKEMSTSSTILSNLSKNTEVTILSKKDNWSNVEVNGIKGYIASKYISDEKVETSVTSRGSDETRKEKEEVVEETKREDKTENITNTTTSQTDTTTTTNTNKVTQNNETKVDETTKNKGTSVKEETKKEETATTTNNKGSQVVSYAKKYLGCKYVSGGNGPTSFDCSGFTSYVYKHFGISLSRTSSGQRSNGKAVKKSDLQPGDIVCFTGHVGIYIGGNQFVHAANPQKGVIITSMSDSYYVRNYITARRVL